MTVSATLPRVQSTITSGNLTSLASDLSSVTFNITFKYLSTAEVVVTRTDSTGSDTELQETTHYTISPSAGATGTMTFTATGRDLFSADDLLTFTRRMEKAADTFDQLTDYTQNDALDADTLEGNFDKSIMISQQLAEVSSRQIAFSSTATFDSTASKASTITGTAASRQNKLLGFDSAGDISATQDIGTYKGTSATTTTSDYNIRDIVKSSTAGQLNNVYICIKASPSGTALTNTTYWELIFDAYAASSSATTATTKASEAATSATNAASSATTATTQATTATTKASEASTSATNAASSATAAASSASNAAASFDSFDDRYLGPMADSASGGGNGVSGTFNGTKDGPGDDNDGNALVTGALYFNTTDGEMRVYDGSNWIAASAAQNATVLDYTYTLSGSDNTISGSDDNSASLAFTAQESVDVFLNGVKLVPKIGSDANDYHLDTSNTVTLASTAVSGDVILVRVYKTFTVGDAVPASTGGTFSGNVAYTGNIQVDDIIEKTSAHGVEIEGVLVKDSIVQTDDIQEKTSAHGVEIDGVLLKDGGGTFTGNVVIPDGGNIGSASDTDAISIASDGNISLGAGIVSGNLGTITQRSASSSSPTFSDNNGNTITLANLYGTTSITIGHPSNGDTHAWLAWDYGAGVTRKITKLQWFQDGGGSNSTGIFLEGSNVASPNASAGHSDWTQLKSFGSIVNDAYFSYSSPVTATTLKYRHYRMRYAWSSVNAGPIKNFLLEDTDSTFDIRAPLNAVGTAPTYACRAWVNFNGQDTPAIRNSGNVSSLTDNGTGSYIAKFTTPLPDSNYAVGGYVEPSVSNAGSDTFASTGNSSASQVGITHYEDGSQQDSQWVSIIVIR